MWRNPVFTGHPTGRLANRNSLTRTTDNFGINVSMYRKTQPNKEKTHRRPQRGDENGKGKRRSLWRDTQMFGGGTSQEVDYEKLKIHNLEDT